MKKLSRMPMIVFLVFIFALFILFLVLPKKEYSSSEKRYLQEAPAFSFSSLFSGEFGEDFEDFLSDQFAGRNFWVGLNAYYNLALGNNGASGIYHAKDGYLVNLPTTGDRLAVNFGVIEDFSEKHSDIPSAVLIAPSTGYICDDILPAVHLSYKDDELFDLMYETLSAPAVADVRETFKAEYESGRQIYYKTDHHWTSYGAFTAYRALGETLGFTPNDASSYRISSYDGFYGTTYSSSGFWLTVPDTIEVWESADNDAVHVSIEDGAKSSEQNGMFYAAHLEEDDKYPVFLDGNHPLTVIENPNADSGKKLLVIKDSFAHSLTPFLSAHYAQITMIDMRYYKKNVSDLIEEEGFDQILFVYSVDNLATDVDLVWLE